MPTYPSKNIFCTIYDDTPLVPLNQSYFIHSYGAYRQGNSRKWYAIIGSVPLYKLDHNTDSRKEVEVINVKADSGKIRELLAQKGYYPAFHMNKKCWVSIILDDTLADKVICTLVDDSYKSV